MKVLLVALLSSCVVASSVLDFGNAPEAACAGLSQHCAHVYMCAAGSSNELGHIETCVPDDEPVWDAEETYGRPCVATPRHEGTCVWGCKDDPWEHACNALDGCFGCKRSER